MGIVLVANSITERQLTDRVGHRLVGFLPRRQTGMPQILAAVLDGWAGHALLPAALVRSLIEDLRVLQADEASPVGFTEREISIVRLLAEGWTTEEIADKLGYSERTIKNTLHSLNVRLGLRNRAHAVGYGARSASSDGTPKASPLTPVSSVLADATRALPRTMRAVSQSQDSATPVPF
ncbi:LuxR C-terminal-related transcriptional regulator [Streptomyces sp. NPDC052015]|uniref:helix-turn-helix transcriptional regulator n=1 Tax=Streptomyces sp. NPDC052015 TaxID=3154755 RepID=UPI003441DB1F